jgi:acetyltransferase
MSHYPEEYQKLYILADGTKIFLRPIKASDDNLLLELFNALTPETIHLRFFSTLKYMPKEVLEQFTHVDYDKQMAIVALIDENDRERMVGVGRYTLLADEPGAAEFAIVVQDSMQGRGIGSAILYHLAHVAKLQNVHTIVGYIINENHKMFGALKKSGLTMKRKFWDRGITRVDIPIDENIQIR